MSISTIHGDTSAMAIRLQPLVPSPQSLASSPQPAAPSEVREAFDDFVGQTFFNQLLSEMRKTQTKPAYFHGGQAEEIFQAQMDQVLAERLSDATAETFSGPMFELFMLGRG
jgi:flagellar protein FlgJ